MTKHFMNLALIAAFTASGGVASAFASDAARDEARQVIELKDGSTLYVFRDGKMAKEDKVGRVASLRKGEVVEAKNGQSITVVGNETARLRQLLQRGHGGR